MNNMKFKSYSKYKDSGIDWIGEIPEGWEVHKIKHLTENFDGKRIPISAEKREDGKIPYYGATGVLDYVKDFIFNEELLLVGEDGAPFFEPFKDVAYIINGKSWVNNHAHVLRVIGNNLIKWLCYYLNIYDYGTVIKGSTRDKLNQDQLSNMFIVKPSLKEQTAIAYFLDKETSKINSLTEKDNKLIELLKEKRTALINHAVTKGLDPNAKLKDSGIDWIGKIPEEWEVRRIKHLCFKSAEYGLNEPSDNYIDDGIRFLRITDITDGGNLIENGVYLAENKTNKGYLLNTDDVLVARSGSIGTSLYFEKEKYGKCLFAGYLVRFVVNKTNSGRFLYYFTNSKSFYAQIDLKTIQTTIGNFNGQKYANMRIATPPLPEQIAIVSYLDKETLKIDKTIQKLEQKIKLLEEYKKSLIHHIVTGKIDVRGSGI